MGDKDLKIAFLLDAFPDGSQNGEQVGFCPGSHIDLVRMVGVVCRPKLGRSSLALLVEGENDNAGRQEQVLHILLVRYHDFNEKYLLINVS